MVNQKGNFIQASVPQDKIINNSGKTLLDLYLSPKVEWYEITLVNIYVDLLVFTRITGTS